MANHGQKQRIPVLRESPFAPRQRPKARRPIALDDVSDPANCALVSALLFANVQLDEPQGLTWWADRHDAADIETVFRALVDANPRLLKLEDRRSAVTPALYVERVDSCLCATLYFARPELPK